MKVLSPQGKSELYQSRPCPSCSGPTPTTHTHTPLRALHPLPPRTFPLCPPPTSTFSLDAYRWAIATIWSRFVSIKIGGSMYKAMVPFFDCLNHNPAAKTLHAYDEKVGVCVVFGCLGPS